MGGHEDNKVQLKSAAGFFGVVKRLFRLGVRCCFGDRRMTRDDFVEKFRARQGQMLDFLEQARTLVASVGSQTAPIEQLIGQLKQSTFKVLVIGEFKRGKSTFINALLGAEILPSSVNPCTAIISEVKYGSRKAATVYFNTDVGELPEGVSPDAVDYINRHKAKGAIPPLKVPFKQLRDYVAISGAEATGERQEPGVGSPFNHAEIRVPLGLCKSGVEIIDSPGLNEQEERSAIATGYVDEADAIIFVLSCENLASMTEMAAIKDFERRGNRSIFFVCNKIDNVDEEEQEDLKEHARKRLLCHTDLKERGVYFVSAKQALEARTTRRGSANRDALEARSGFQQMEEGLRIFLNNDRGRVKLNKPGELLLEQLEKKLPSDISGNRRRWKRGADKAKAECQELLDDLESIKDGVARGVACLQGEVAQVRQRFRKMFAKMYKYIVNHVEDWVSECEPNESFGLWMTEEKIDRIAKKLANLAKNRARSELTAWVRTELSQAIEEEMEAFQARVNEIIADIQGDVANGEYLRFDSKSLNRVANFSFDFDGLANVVKSAFVTGLTLDAIDSSGLTGGIGLVRGLFGDNDLKMGELKADVGKKLVSAFRRNQSGAIENAIDDLSLFDELEHAIKRFSKMLDGGVREFRKRVALAEESCQAKEQEQARQEAVLDDILLKAKALSCEVKTFLREVNA